MSIKIITDTGADLSEEIINQYSIQVIPMTIHFGEEIFEDRINLTNEEFFEKLNHFKGFPKTASPSPGTFVDAIENADEEDILIITMSSQLSSTYQNALIAQNMSDKNVVVIDSKNASIGVALPVILAARMAQQGKELEQIKTELEKYIEQQYTVFIVETMDYLIKGGRINKYAGMLASALNIKLISIKSPEGAIELVEKCRGSQKAFKKMFDMIQQRDADLSNKVVGITHVNALERAIQMKELLKEQCGAQEIIISEMGATIGSHTGEGTILVSF